MRIVMAGVAVLLLIAADDNRGEAARELALLQGEWSMASGEMDGSPLPAEFVKSGRRVAKGDETTVTVRGRGRGGRNAEFLLALAVALEGLPGVDALAADTDGIDGTEDNAGAVIAPDTLARAAQRGLAAKAFLADNDGYSFFGALDDLVVTGPTFTNVNDFRAILIDESTGNR